MAAYSLLRAVRCHRLVLRRKYVVYDGRRVQPFSARTDGVLRVCESVRYRIPVGSSRWCWNRAACVPDAYPIVSPLCADRGSLHRLVASGGDHRPGSRTETDATTRESALLVRYRLGGCAGGNSRCTYCRALPRRFGHGHEPRPVYGCQLVRWVFVAGKRFPTPYDTPARGQLGRLCRHGHWDLGVLLAL